MPVELEWCSEVVSVEDMMNIASQGNNGTLYRVYRVDISDPNVWQSEDGRYLLGDLFMLTRSAFGRQTSQQLMEDTRQHIENGEYLYLVCNDGIVAFTVLRCWNVNSVPVLYLSGMIVAPAHQSKGVSSALLGDTIRQHCPQFLVARTQNPVMYESIARVCRSVFPNGRSRSPQEVVSIAEFVAREKLGMNDFSPSTMTEVGTYGCCLYGQEPRSRHHEIENWFKSAVCPQRGDSMIVVGIL